MGRIRLVSIFGTIAALYFALLPKIFDFEQCNRTCAIHFGGLNTHRVKDSSRKIWGYWTVSDRVSNTQRCYCSETTDGKVHQLGDIPRLNEEEELGYPFVWKDPSVCAVSGKVYQTKEAARQANDEPIHCGPHCGECSNKHDIGRYRTIGDSIPKVVGPCILAYLTAGSLADTICMESRAQFTKPCTGCWVEDHGCLAVHCFYDCVFKGKQHWERLLGINNANDKTPTNETCLVCMEKYCSAPFIRTCGVNRRSAGIRTDVSRVEREICVL